jgi:RND superfamily putative drug exporter
LVDAWAPVFFFALVSALAMDYTVFLLATVKEHFDETGDAREAAIAGLAHTGRLINAAGGVMVVVFLTFALSGPIPPKEMGVVLAVAVLLDATLIRLVLLPVTLRLLGARPGGSPTGSTGRCPRCTSATAAYAKRRRSKDARPRRQPRTLARCVRRF